MIFLIIVACAVAVVILMKNSNDRAEAAQFGRFLDEQRNKAINSSEESQVTSESAFSYNEPVAAQRVKTVTYYDPWQQHARIIVDSFRIINETTNPDTFFYRCSLVADEAQHICDVPDIIYDGMTAKELYDWYYDKEEQTSFQEEFIDRLFEAGREDRLAYQFFEVGNRLTDEALDYYLQELDGKKFHFCKVQFDINGRKTYTYITKNRDTQLYDTVTVKTGNRNFPETKVVQVMDVFDAPLTEIPFSLRDLRCVDSTLRNIKCPNCGASIQIDVGTKKGKCAYCRTDFSLL